jgi:DNA-binding CsgD family transcriptional regulator
MVTCVLHSHRGCVSLRVDVTIATVKTYVGRLLAKLDARGRVHLVIIAYQIGLVTPADH